MSRPPDHHVGSFSDNPPWVISPDAVVWAKAAEHGAAAARASVPDLVRRRSVPPLGRVGVAAGSLGWAVLSWSASERRAGGSASRAGLSRRLRRSFERLGSTYIKLGQVLSSGDSLFPDELVAEFRLCRDQVPAETFADVRRVVEEDLGRPVEAVFSSFDREPLAAASIAQVHAATLTTGEKVVVKVQRPGIDGLVRRDLAAMAWAAPLRVGRIPVSALANPPALVELFAETIIEELDFRIEARNMLDVAAMLVEIDQRSLIVPRPHPELVTRRVLVMERLAGFKIDDVSEMQAAGIDTRLVLRALVITFFEGAMIHGVFHGDYHGGNLFVLPDGRIALLDFGITGRLGSSRRLALMQVLFGAVTNDIRSQLAGLRDLGALPPETDLERVVIDLGLDQPPADLTTMSGEEMAAEVGRTVKALLGYGARLPKELMLFVKNMLFLNGATALLAPDIDIFDEVLTLMSYFTEAHGEALSADLGLDVAAVSLDFDAMRAMIGLGDDETVTFRDLHQRREELQERVRQERGSASGMRGRRGRRPA